GSCHLGSAAPGPPSGSRARRLTAGRGSTSCRLATAAFRLGFGRLAPCFLGLRALLRATLLSGALSSRRASLAQRDRDRLFWAFHLAAAAALELALLVFV